MIKRVLTAITKEQVQTILDKKFQGDKAIIQSIMSADPTPNKGYCVWIAKLLLNKNIRMPEDAQKIFDKLTLFEDYKKRGKIKGVDINQLKSYADLARVVEQGDASMTKKEDLQNKVQTGQTQVWQKGSFTIWQFNTVEALMDASKGTEWCTAYPDMAEHYFKEGDIFIVRYNGQPAALLHPASGQAKNVKDQELGHGLVDEEYGEYNDFGDYDDESPHSVVTNGQIVDAIWPFVEKLNVYNDDFQIFLWGRDKKFYYQHIDVSHEFLLRYKKQLLDGIFDINDFIEAVYESDKIKDDYKPGIITAALDDFDEYQYGTYHEDVMYDGDGNERSKEELVEERRGMLSDKSERIILSNPYTAVSYASNVYGSDAPEVDKAILDWCKEHTGIIESAARLANDDRKFNRHDPLKFLDEYLRMKANRRWPEIEPYILLSIDEVCHYVGTCLQSQRWPEAEQHLAQQLIKTSTKTYGSFVYRRILCQEILAYCIRTKTRMENIEPYLFNEELAFSLINPAVNYCGAIQKDLPIVRGVLLERIKEAENVGHDDNIVSAVNSATHYAQTVLHGRWPEIEPIILRASLRASGRYVKDVYPGRWPEYEEKLVDSVYEAFAHSGYDIRSSEAFGPIYFARIYAKEKGVGLWPELAAAFDYMRDRIEEKYKAEKPQFSYKYDADIGVLNKYRIEISETATTK